MVRKEITNIDEDDDIDSSIKMPPRKQCPTYCSLFKCTVAENLNGKCRQECSKLDLTKSLICEICEKKCTKEQKMIFLDTKYFDHMSSVKNDENKSKVSDVKTEYRAMEIQLQAIRDEFYRIPSYNFTARNSLKSKSSMLKNKMLIYIEIMEMLGIKFDKNIDLDS